MNNVYERHARGNSVLVGHRSGGKCIRAYQPGLSAVIEQETPARRAEQACQPAQPTRRIRTLAQAKREILRQRNEGVPAAPSVDDILTAQWCLGLR